MTCAHSLQRVVPAENGLVELINKYGKETVRDYLNELQDHAERVMRAEIAQIPDGVYRFTDYIDGVGESPEPIRISVTVEVKGEEIVIDFDGTSRTGTGCNQRPYSDRSLLLLLCDSLPCPGRYPEL